MSEIKFEFLQQQLNSNYRKHFIFEIYKTIDIQFFKPRSKFKFQKAVKNSNFKNLFKI